MFSISEKSYPLRIWQDIRVVAQAFVLAGAAILTAEPAFADRPGTPNNVMLQDCGTDLTKRPALCLTLVNTAHEDVWIEMEAKRNGVIVPLEKTLYCEVGMGCYSPTTKVSYRGENSTAPVAPTLGATTAGNDNSPATLEAMNKWGGFIADLEFDTQYCVRFQARRVSDQMVSEMWSNTSCATTRSLPAPPTAVDFSYKFKGAQWGQQNPPKPIAATLEIQYQQGARGMIKTVIRSASDGATLYEHEIPYMTSLKPFDYPINPSAPLFKIETCVTNLAGHACNTKLGNAEAYDLGLQGAPSAQGRPGTLPQSATPNHEPKVIVQTGRPVDGTPLALAPFAGSWKTDTDQNGHYLLALNMNGNQVSGTFTNSAGDQKYNGTLTGTVDGNQLRYTYVQPAVNGKGSGFFVLLNGGAGIDDDAITGSGTTDDASQTKFKWTGRRQVAGSPPAAALPPPSRPIIQTGRPRVFDETFAVGTNLGGSDYRNVALNDNFPSTCRDLCAKEAPCKAWTWVKPGVQQAKAVCWLKNAIPTPNADANTTSGVKLSGDPGVR